MGDTMHSRSNTRSRSNQVVRGIVASLLLSIGLSHSVTARAIEPRAIPLESAPLQEKPEERCADQVIEGGVAATMLFATLGLGAGVVAAAIDAESERLLPALRASAGEFSRFAGGRLATHAMPVAAAFAAEVGFEAAFGGEGGLGALQADFG